jgi:hypothetical protein
MKTLARISAFLVLGSTMAPAQAHRDTSVHPLVASTRLQLIATTKQPTTKVGSPIVVRLTLKNISTEIITVGDSSPEIDNGTTVTDTSGKELPRTD